MGRVGRVSDTKLPLHLCDLIRVEALLREELIEPCGHGFLVDGNDDERVGVGRERVRFGTEGLIELLEQDDRVLGYEVELTRLDEVDLWYEVDERFVVIAVEVGFFVAGLVVVGHDVLLSSLLELLLTGPS